MYGSVPDEAAAAASEAAPLTGVAAASAQSRRRKQLQLRLATAGLVAIAFAVGFALATRHSDGGESSSAASRSPADMRAGHKQPRVVLYQSSKLTGERVAQTSVQQLQPSKRTKQHSKKHARGRVTIDASKRYQEIQGFGAAFTDAATINFYKLPQAAQDAVMDAYFGKGGLGYSIGRVPMGSCDFSVDQYSFANVSGDYSLQHFDTSIAYDQKQRIPMLREAVKRTPDLKLFVSPWSPPAWMKVCFITLKRSERMRVLLLLLLLQQHAATLHAANRRLKRSLSSMRIS
jgi:glucosylceramidase